MFRSLLIAVTLVTLVGCNTAPPEPTPAALPDGITLIESVNKQDGELRIPFRKYRLDNGLTVILHEDHSDPLVHVDVTYHVGSAREEAGKSGFAHFFEHMMFQGSEHVDDEEHFRIISEAGGTLNGTTNTDRTNYYQTVPANQLETVLWLEADRMGFLLNAVTKEKFEVQRETVKNERGQNYDNRPYGLVGETVAAAMYPPGHPYSWPTIGFVADLDRVGVTDLKQFFLRWYGPNNATLTIGGDVDVARTLKLVNRYFGSIPAGPEVVDADKAPATLPGDRYVSIEDNVHLPLLYMAYPTVYARHADEAPLDVLAEILGGQGKTSLFYKNLIKSGVAVQAVVSHPCRELACSLNLLVLPNPRIGGQLEKMEQIVRDTLKEFEQRGVEEDDLTMVKAKFESGTIYGLQSVAGKVSQLAAGETFTGNPDTIGVDLERYRAVTAEDVMRVYRKYVKDQSAVVLSVVPHGQLELVARSDNFRVPPRTVSVDDDTGAELLPVREPVDDFDRSQKPEPGANPLVTVPDMWRAELANGIEILGAVNDETPTVAVSIEIATGHIKDPVEKSGLAALTAAMLNESTQNYSNEAYSKELQKLGSSVSMSAGDYYTSLSINSLSKNLDRTLELAVEKLLRPAFSKADFQRVKAQTIQGVQAQKKQASVLANNVYRKLLFGANNAIGLPGGGTVDSLEKITLDDVKRFYQQEYSPRITSIVTVGNLAPQTMQDKLSVFGHWQGPDVAAPQLAEFPEFDRPRLYFIDKPGAAQSEIRIGKRSLPFDATGEYYRAGLMNFNLGGAFNSRININLREDKGYTYGAFSSFRGAKDFGRFTAGAGVRADVTADAISEFLSEINSFREQGLTEAELEFLKKAVGQRDARKYETPRQKLGFLLDLLAYDLHPDYVAEQGAILESIDREELNALAQKHLDPKDMIIVVVGDRKTVLPELQVLDYEIVELDEEGNRLP